MCVIVCLVIRRCLCCLNCHQKKPPDGLSIWFTHPKNGSDRIHNTCDWFPCCKLDYVSKIVSALFYDHLPHSIKQIARVGAHHRCTRCVRESPPPTSPSPPHTFKRSPKPPRHIPTARPAAPHSLPRGLRVRVGIMGRKGRRRWWGEGSGEGARDGGRAAASSPWSPPMVRERAS